MTRQVIPWTSGRWSTEPAAYEEKDGELIVEACQGSDYWQTTMYGFERDNGHSLLLPWDGEEAVEVTFRLTAFDHLYDQAGLMLWSHGQQWIKAGIEMNDGVPHLGAVVTHGYSDWSLAPVPEWMEKIVTIRASRLKDAVIIRARTEGEDWRTVRVCRLTPDEWQAGPYLCAPTSAGLKVAFTRWATAQPDADVHEQPPEL